MAQEAESRRQSQTMSPEEIAAIPMGSTSGSANNPLAGTGPVSGGFGQDKQSSGPSDSPWKGLGSRTMDETFDKLEELGKEWAELSKEVVEDPKEGFASIQDYLKGNKKPPPEPEYNGYVSKLSAVGKEKKEIEEELDPGQKLVKWGETSSFAFIGLLVLLEIFIQTPLFKDNKDFFAKTFLGEVL